MLAGKFRCFSKLLRTIIPGHCAGNDCFVQDGFKSRGDTRTAISSSGQQVWGFSRFIFVLDFVGENIGRRKCKEIYGFAASCIIRTCCCPAAIGKMLASALFYTGEVFCGCLKMCLYHDLFKKRGQFADIRKQDEDDRCAVVLTVALL
ncbi:MAG TPA: hypothetical protein DDY13_09155 [Cytophagales bacterium]|nr:hypothetical protein [Cytophagales bacterium]